MPGVLARLVDDSWDLYDRFLSNKDLVPKRNFQVRKDSDETSGVLLRWRLEGNIDWDAVLTELGGYADLAIIDLVDQLPRLVGPISEDAQRAVDRLSYSPTTIKGLDRKTILVLGLASVLQEISVTVDRHGDLVALDTRNRIDEIRVALSRSTNTLVLVEDEDASLDQAPMGLGKTPSVAWKEVQRHLREQYEDLDLFERINDLLYLAGESLAGNDLTRAGDNIREAERLVVSVEDDDLRAQVAEQRRQVDRALVQRQHRNARESLDADEADVVGASAALSDVENLITALNDPQLNREAAVLKEAVDLVYELRKARETLARKHFGSAYASYKDLAAAVAQSDFPEPKRLDKELREGLKPRLDGVAQVYWEAAEKARKRERYSEVSSAYRRMATVREDQGRGDNAGALQYLADRYEKLPPSADPVIDATELCRYIDGYAQILRRTESGAKTAQNIAVDWLIEMCLALESQPEQYPPVANRIRILVTGGMADFAWNYPEFRDAAQRMLEEGIPTLRKRGQMSEALDMLSVFDQVASDDIRQMMQAPGRVMEILAMIDQLYPSERQTLLKVMAQRTKELNDTAEGSE